MEFAWSLKPIFIWLMICLGIDLDRSNKKSKIHRWLIIFYSFCLLICITMPAAVHNIVLNVLYKSKEKNIEGKQLFRQSAAMNVTRKIFWTAIRTLFFLIHLSLVVSVRFKWKPLWKKLKTIESMIYNQIPFYRQLRRDAIIGLLMLLVVTLFHSPNNNFAFD